MERYKMALEVLNELQEEIKIDLTSPHYSVRCSGERKLQGIEDLKEEINYKIEELEG